MSGLLKRIIPCLDVKNGRVVKGVNFVNLRDMGDPVELAKRYEDEGADEVVFLDISATSEGRDTALDIVKRVAQELTIPFTLGGGLKNVDDIYQFLNAGADKIALNSQALKTPELIDEGAKQFGSQCIVVAMDAKKDAQGDYGIFTHGGSKDSGKKIRPWAQEVADRGAGEILLTCIDRDGTGIGFDNDITGEMAKKLKIQVIASGGAKTDQHLLDAFQAGADAVLAATMFHDGSYKIADVKKFLHDNGIPVRLEK